MSDPAPRVPVHVLAGFLGAGKTTLLNRILTERHGERIAVIVNEFGEVGIDGSLIVRSEEEVIELANGCVCCTVRGDLARAAGELLRRRRRKLFRSEPFERLLVEGSGLADPGPVLQTFLLEPELAATTELASVVTLVHAARIRSELELHPECVRQVGYADVLLVNHVDRVDEADLAATEARLGELNPLAARHRTRFAEFPVAELLAARHVGGAPGSGAHATEAGAHEHSPGATSVVLRARAPLDLHGLKMWLQFVSAKRGQALWRTKGVLACRDHPTAIVVQGVYQWLELGPGDGPPPTESVLVLIGEDLDREELERGWRAVLQAADERR